MPTPSAEAPRHGRAWWRGAAFLSLVASGAILGISAADSGSDGLTPERYVDLASLVSGETERVQGIQQQVADANAEVAKLAEAVDDREVRAQRERAEQSREAAGLTRVLGPGLRVVMADAPREVIEAAEVDANLLVVHQQDLQAVVNAMWRGGATAVTLQGQRIVSTTGIKCTGNTVTLQGVAYGQPYVIEAVGDQARLLRSISEDDYLELYRDQAADDRVQIGWDLTTRPLVRAPAYDGPMSVSYARPTGSATS